MLDLCYNCYINVNCFICRVVVNADAPYIKMVTEQFDRCHGILLQYVDFLSSAVSPATAYAQLVPSLEELVQTNHLEPEVFLSFLCPLFFTLVLLQSSTIWISSLFACLFWSTLLGITILILRLLTLLLLLSFRNYSLHYEAQSYVLNPLPGRVFGISTCDEALQVWTEW